jgi:hypothetical protein
MNGQFIDDFNMGKPLPVCAYFVLAFDNTYPASFQYAKHFPGCLEIKVQYGLMIFLCSFNDFIIPVIPFIALVIDMGASARNVHIRRVKNYAIIGIRFIR